MDEMTTDVFEGDFPPASYGLTLEQVEATIAQVVERVFRDDDGILRSCVHGRTMKPMRAEDVKNRPQGLGTFAENSSIPRRVKTTWVNYEDAGQASGTYLEALCAKACMTDDPRVREQARRTVDALVTLWENAAATKHPNGGGGRGWLPKPYAGIHDVAEMHECSADQFGQAIWWKRLDGHSMATGFFLYLNALAQSWSPSRKFQHGFDIWMGLKNKLYPPEPVWVCMNGVALECLERLIVLRPELDNEWRIAAAHQAQLVATSVEKPTALNKKYEVNGFAAHYLVIADRLIPHNGYDLLARRCLEACTRRENFYHVRRGCRVADLDNRESGDDFLDVFHCELHVHWLAGYWKSRQKTL